MLNHLDLLDTLSDDEISQEDYDFYRKIANLGIKTDQDWLIGAVGFLCSYNGKFFGGRAKITHTKEGTIRNYYDEAKRNLQKQAPALKDVTIIERDYRTIAADEFQNCVIYCDPPYKNTTGYQTGFNSDEFWQWAKDLSKYNIVLVSEQEAPENWDCIWQGTVKRSLDFNGQFDGVEKLFKLNGDNTY